MISGLTRAAVGADEPTRAMLLSVTTELRKLDVATAGILSHARAGGPGEVSLPTFVRQLGMLSEAAEEPLKIWLKGIGEALLFLGDAMDQAQMPPPPARHQQDPEKLEIDIFSTNIHQNAGLQPRRGVRDLAQSVMPLDDAGLTSRPVVRLPRATVDGTKEAPIVVPDSPHIKCEPADDEEPSPEELEALQEPTQTAMPLQEVQGRYALVSVRLPTASAEQARAPRTSTSDSRCEVTADEHEFSEFDEGGIDEDDVDREASARRSELRAIATQPRGSETRPDLEMGYQGGAKPSLCTVCNRPFPFRKQLFRHIKLGHRTQGPPTWMENVPRSTFAQRPKRRREESEVLDSKPDLFPKKIRRE